MKNLLMLVIFAIGITSCSKDSLDPGQEQNYSIVKSEILVTATYIVYNNGQCNNSCGSNEQTIAYASNAQVSVFAGDVQDIDQAPTPLQQGSTDANGKLLVKDLEPGLYSVFIHSSYGDKSRVLYTQLNKRSFIEFSF